MIEAARTATLTVPVTRVAAGAEGISAVLILPLVGAAVLIDPLTLLVVGTCVRLGALMVRIGLLASRPLLRAVMR